MSTGCVEGPPGRPKVLFRFGLTKRRDEFRRTVVVTAAVVAAIDQLAKAVALELFASVDSSFGPIRFTIVRNSGGPFGLADGASLAWTATTAAVLIAAIVVIGRGRLDFRPALAAGAMIGGGLGNLVDRLVRQPGLGNGAVIDWISFEPYPRVFNLADVALRVTALIVFAVMLVHRDQTSRTTDDDERRIAVDDVARNGK